MAYRLGNLAEMGFLAPHPRFELRPGTPALVSAESERWSCVCQTTVSTGVDETLLYLHSAVRKEPR